MNPWLEYRTRERLWWWSSFIAVAVLLFTIFLTDDINMTLLIALIVVVNVLYLRLTSWPCPRCGKAFHGYMFYFNWRCLSCALPRWQWPLESRAAERSE